MERDKLELGKRYRDIASGFEGIASSVKVIAAYLAITIGLTGLGNGA